MTKTIGFAVAEGDIARLDNLVERYGRGNRSEFLREAIRLMEAADRAQRLQRLQALGTARSAERRVAPDDINAIVKKVLASRES